MNQKSSVNMKREDDIGLLEINNPPENYLDRPDFIDLTTLKEFTGSGIKALVISGVGRHFSAGADLKSIKQQIKQSNSFQESLKKGNYLLNFIDEMSIPVIAAISGVCFGAGLEIALSCDIRYCDKKSLFAFPEINHELFPAMGGYKRLATLTGKQAAIEMIIKGDMINAEKASELSIVEGIVDEMNVEAYSSHFAKAITRNRKLKVIKAIMKSISNHEKLSNSEAIIEDAAMFTSLAKDAFAKNDS